MLLLAGEFQLVHITGIISTQCAVGVDASRLTSVKLNRVSPEFTNVGDQIEHFRNDFPQILPRLAHRALSAADVLRRFDSLARRVEPPGKAPVSCKDQDDQKFVDLAVAHRAVLLSKDGAVLALRKRLAVLGVPVATAWPDTRM